MLLLKTLRRTGTGSGLGASVGVVRRLGHIRKSMVQMRQNTFINKILNIYIFYILLNIFFYIMINIYQFKSNSK